MYVPQNLLLKCDSFYEKSTQTKLFTDRTAGKQNLVMLNIETLQRQSQT